MPRLRDILSATFSEGSIADNLRKRQDEQRVLDEAVRKRVRLPKRFFGAEEEGDFEFESGNDAAAALTSVMKRPESQRRVKVRLSEIDNRVPANLDRELELDESKVAEIYAQRGRDYNKEQQEKKDTEEKAALEIPGKQLPSAQVVSVTEGASVARMLAS